MSLQPFRLLIFLAALACLTLGQGTATPAPPANRSFSGAATFGYPRFAPPTITGAPFSGEEVSESVQILADGTRITRKAPGRKMYRDFAGRTRTERVVFPGLQPAGAAPAGDVIVSEIYDPVTNFRYTLDPINRVAHRIKLEPFPARPAANPSSSQVSPASPAAQGLATKPPVFQGTARPRPTISAESLGTQVISGVQVEGHRTTETIPAEAQGNDRPISTITETWMSSELKITVLSKRSDPRSGESKTEILNLSRAEPDPFLFTVPADYSLVDETGSFTIRFGR